MNIKKVFNKTVGFTVNKFIEFSGIILLIFSILLLASLVSYAPEDPNFIYSEKKEIKNLIGIHGSYISDLLLQSFGLIVFLVPVSSFVTGINIFKTKKLFLLLENLFFIVLYLITGSLFLSLFYNDSFLLSINGNGGFLGDYLKNVFINYESVTDKFFYFIFIFLTILFFFISIDMNIKKIINLISNLKNMRGKTVDKNNFKNNTTQTEFMDGDLLKRNNRIQEDLPFNKVKNNLITSSKFVLPKLNVLNLPDEKDKIKDSDYNFDNEFIEKILLDFGVQGKIKKINHGPVVTLNEFEPAPGVKVSKIINLAEDIARNTSSESARISTIPGSNMVGIEIPNERRENVYLREIISNKNFIRKENKLPIALGKSISGVPVLGDLSTMPHLLIAGTTGSGKSVCINTIILSLLYKHPPDKCKFILIDPKMLELSTYEGIPHLLCPVITEPKKATSVLGWVVKEMENRYKLMTREGVRNIDGYNSKHKLSMPYIVVIVDEMSDLMHVAGKEIENYIQKLSQMARASGIHIIMATQRPSVDVITGTIKANFPTRISFQVSSKIDSRTILGEQGAEQLLGKGDMLYMSSANRIVRIHAPFVSDDEIEKVNDFIRSQAEPDYIDEILNFSDKNDSENQNENLENQDELYTKAIELIRIEKKASTSFLQRKLQIGYNRAARIIDMLEENGIVSKANHVGKRDVIK